jgi:predicted aspartyl protease
VDVKAGKLAAVHSKAEVASARAFDNHRLCINDRISGTAFLIDTGANVSVIPVSRISDASSRECSYRLYAANGTEIKTYGTISLKLHLGLCKPLIWTFIICDVKQPILGADFLKANKLLVDLHNGRLVDSSSNVFACGPVVKKNQAIYTVQAKHPYRDILDKYPDITRLISFREPAKHNVKHHIETSGPPVFARARPLPPERFEKVREEFRVMQELGICRPSKSPWASPLHVVPKKDGQLRACGDYRRLNNVTKPDRYPIPRLQDFTYGMAGKKLFTTLDINRAYHAIEMAPEDIERQPS